MTSVNEPMDLEQEAHHLLRCLILMAMADSVLHDAERRVLEQVVQTLGPIHAETWEQAWEILDEGQTTSAEVFAEVPADDRLRRFILRELVGMAMVDGHIAESELDMIQLAASTFELSDEVTCFLDWANRAQAVFDEGEALLDPS